MLLKEPGQGGNAIDELDHFLTLRQKLRTWNAQRRIVAGDLVFVRIEAGDYGRKRGAADAAGNVAACEGQALRCQLVNVWRLDVRVSHESVIGPCLVVGNDQDDVEWSGGSEGRHEKSRAE